MMTNKITMGSDDYEIRVVDKRDAPTEPLEMMVIKALIDGYDAHFLEKQGYDDAAEQFYEAILGAVAAHSAVDSPVPINYHDSLKFLLESLGNTPGSLLAPDGPIANPPEPES